MGISLLPKRWRENELVKTECKELDSIQYSEVEEDCSTQKIGEMVKMLQEYALICDSVASEWDGLSEDLKTNFFVHDLIFFLVICGAKKCFLDDENYYYVEEKQFLKMVDTVDVYILAGLFRYAKLSGDFETCAKYLINLNIIPFPEERHGEYAFERYYGKNEDENEEITYVVKVK